MKDVILELDSVSKAFDGKQVLERLNLEIGRNEFITLLGPSGCGKSTTLRIIGGFEKPDEGRVLFEGKDITGFSPDKRNVNTVFQKYSLFPHMSVEENIAFGLRLKKKSQQYIKDKIRYALKLVNMDGYESRKPDSLSGGQQQRVAIARAIVNEPEILLLDEPLGALDLKLRHGMQRELIKIKREVGITFVYVTHDQEEALTMSDRIVVMNKGIIQQMGTSKSIYDEPQNAFVADFIGDSNIIDGIMKKDCLVQIQNVPIACVDTGFAITVGSSALAYTPVSLAGTDEQKKMIAEHIVNGGFAAYALTEPDGGSDAGHPHTTAKKVGDEWVINGRKCFITNAPFANIFVVFASTDPTQGSRGVTAFLVERDREGVSIGAHENKMGIRLSQTSDVVFDEVHVPADHMLGAEGAGFKLAMNTLNITRPAGSATVVGLMQNCVDLCIKYAKERVVFGKPISKFQAVQFMIADMQTKTMAARLMVHHAADCIDRGIASPVVGACTKCFCGDSAVEVASNAIQVYGGYGYSRDYPVEKLLRDAKIYQIFEGTNQIQRMTIAGNLLK